MLLQGKQEWLWKWFYSAFSRYRKLFGTAAEYLTLYLHYDFGLLEQADLYLQRAVTCIFVFASTSYPKGCMWTQWYDIYQSHQWWLCANIKASLRNEFPVKDEEVWHELWQRKAKEKQTWCNSNMLTWHALLNDAILLDVSFNSEIIMHNTCWPAHFRLLQHWGPTHMGSSYLDKRYQHWFLSACFFVSDATAWSLLIECIMTETAKTMSLGKQ